jgi:AhpD family alkylhydroperoxidase
VHPAWRREQQELRSLPFPMLADIRRGLSVGRSPEEVLRVLDALQTDELCPCNSHQGDDTLKAADMSTLETLRDSLPGYAGTPKVDLELMALAVSAINGCGTCVASHERQLRQHGLEREAVQSAVRIAATVHAVAGVLEQSGGELLEEAAA